MKRQIVLVDITAMAAPNACIAGIDLKSGATVRVGEPQPTEKFVATAKLRPFDVIEIDYTFDRKSVSPHVEDAEWMPRSFKHKGAMDVPRVGALLEAAAYPSIVEAFGAPAMAGTNGNHGWAPGAGTRSLATVRARSLRIELDRQNRIRASLTDGDGREWAGIPFQDLRVRDHSASCADCADGHLGRIEDEFARQDCLVRVGLTRPYAASGTEPLCWLQVTNVIVPRTHF